MAVFKNESMYLKEWIDFHLLAGIEHFYLYDNSTTDDPSSVLKKYIEEEKVTYIKWEVDNPLAAPYRNHFLTNYGKETEWVAFIDIDEYIFPLQHNNLKEYFNEKIGNNVSCIIIPSTFFGSNNQKKYIKSKPTYRRFTKRNKIGNNIFNNSGSTQFKKKKKKKKKGGVIYKSIVKVGYIEKFDSSHKTTTTQLTLRESLQIINDIKHLHISIMHNIGVYEAKYIRLNHYWCRSEEEYHTLRNFHPGRDGRIDGSWKLLDNKSNDFEETTILDYKEKRKNQSIKKLKESNKDMEYLNLIFHETINNDNKYEKIYCHQYNDNKKCVLCNNGVGFKPPIVKKVMGVKKGEKIIKYKRTVRNNSKNIIKKRRQDNRYKTKKSIKKRKNQNI